MAKRRWRERRALNHSTQSAIFLLCSIVSQATNCRPFFCPAPLHSAARLHNGIDTSATSSSFYAARTTPPAQQISIEYCTGRRWNLRAFWMAQELLTTFQNALEAVTLIPLSEADGRFVVKCYHGGEHEFLVLWDRREKQGFPETKVLKQLVRDEIDPDRYLGHSDSRKQEQYRGEVDGESKNNAPSSDCEPSSEDAVFQMPTVAGTVLPHVAIAYCTGCRWMLRAAYYAQELLHTFDSELKSVSLVPCKDPAGTFVVQVGEIVLWDRTVQGGFPETKELKQLVRDQLNPSKSLGHSESSERKAEADPPADEMDEDEAEEARKFFGVM